jgi:hypothetical protein
MMRRRIVFVFLAAALIPAKDGRATTLARMSVEQMTAAASAVVKVRCLENAARWEGGEIWTITAFEVLEVWKGNAPPQISVRLMGGRVGHLVSTVPGVPQFRPGETAVLFLEPAHAGGLTVTSWAQGTFRIERDRRTGEERATEDTAAWAVYDPATRQFRASGLRHVPLETLRERVAAALEKERSAP